MSFVDALLLIASTDRPIRFLIYKGIYDLPYVKPFAKMIRAIPISSEQRPREMLQSLREATNAIKNGEVVCIFAEGQITRIGQLLPFRRGMERIMKGVDAPIVPVNLDGVWGSIFSFERGRFLWKLPRSIPYPVTVSFGKPMPATTPPFEVRRAVQHLQTDAYRHHRKTHAHAPSLADPYGASSSVPFRHGRQAAPADEMGQRAAERDLSRAPARAAPGRDRRWSASCCRRPFRARS